MCKEKPTFTPESLHIPMYKNPPNRFQLKLEFLDFPNPFGVKLDGENRWVRLSRLIPWEEFEDPYAELFVDDGAVAYPFRMALGAEILKERLGVTDRELVSQISENPYLQYFLGLPRYTIEAPFDASTLVHFRKRLSAEMLKAINERIALQGLARSEKKSQKETEPPAPPSPSSSSTEPEASPAATVQEDAKPPGGKLLMDATCAPEDIRFPNDLSLLNEAREVTEAVVDALWADRPAEWRKAVKPRTYRKKGRIAFLSAIRSRKLSSQKLRRALRYQLRCIRRNQKTIERLNQEVSLGSIGKRLYRALLVVAELERQQRILFSMKEGERRSVPDRIVSVWKPHVRPIVRGKAGCPVEFGAKLSLSVIDGMSFVDRLSFDAYNECGDLIGQAVAYHQRMGCWPASIHADKIYRTRENQAWCKARGIRMSGPMLGRPVADEEVRKRNRKEQRQDEVDRIPVEGRFGVAKRRYSLSRIMRRLKETSESAITMVFLVMNLDKILRELLLRIFSGPWSMARVTLRLLSSIMTPRVNVWPG
jgi:hypothetical protein